jgi:hypothetical protein
VDELEALQTVASLSLLTDGVEDGVDELSTLSVVSLGPVVTSTRLSEDEVVWAEELTEWSCTDGIHGSWLEVDEDGTWYITSAGGFIVVNVDTFNLEFRVSAELAAWVNSMLVRDNLPELSSNLVSALACLNMN